jgi:hypothetical protein
LKQCERIHRDASERLLEVETFGEDELARIREAIRGLVNDGAANAF